MRFAVVGHTEWVTFARVDRLPVSGEIATASEAWDEPAGGGAVAAAQLARLAGNADFFTSIGNDVTGDRTIAALGQLKLDVHAARWPAPHTTAFVYLEATGERTITVLHRGPMPLGKDPLPWELLDQTDGVYFVKGDVEALRQARRARVLVATARILPLLASAGVEVDALVHSAHDAGERYRPGDLNPAPRLVVATEGAHGGTWSLATGEHGRFSAVALPGPVADMYGAGDSFAAGLTFALGRKLPLEEALGVAARCGADALMRRGAHGV
jgi:ribokinase